MSSLIETCVTHADNTWDSIKLTTCGKEADLSTWTVPQFFRLKELTARVSRRPEVYTDRSYETEVSNSFLNSVARGVAEIDPDLDDGIYQTMEPSYYTDSEDEQLDLIDINSKEFKELSLDDQEKALDHNDKVLGQVYSSVLIEDERCGYNDEQVQEATEYIIPDTEVHPDDEPFDQGQVFQYVQPNNQTNEELENQEAQDILRDSRLNVSQANIITTPRDRTPRQTRFIDEQATQHGIDPQSVLFNEYVDEEEIDNQIQFVKDFKEWLKEGTPTYLNQIEGCVEDILNNFEGKEKWTTLKKFLRKAWKNKPSFAEIKECLDENLEIFRNLDLEVSKDPEQINLNYNRIKSLVTCYYGDTNFNVKHNGFKVIRLLNKLNKKVNAFQDLNPDKKVLEKKISKVEKLADKVFAEFKEFARTPVVHKESSKILKKRNKKLNKLHSPKKKRKVVFDEFVKHEYDENEFVDNNIELKQESPHDEDSQLSKKPRV